MKKTIIYFTQGPHVTAPELAEIDTINAIAEKPYDVLVVDATKVGNDYGAGRLIPGDYVAGTVPDSYKIEDDEEERIYPDFDPENPPDPALPATQAIVRDGDVLDVTGGTVTLTVADNVVTAEFTATEP